MSFTNIFSRSVFLLLVFVLNISKIYSRSKFRKIDPRQGYITISFVDDDKKVIFNNPHLQYDPIFKSFNSTTFT